jgi:hypothetical protein
VRFALGLTERLLRLPFALPGILGRLALHLLRLGLGLLGGRTDGVLELVPSLLWRGTVSTLLLFTDLKTYPLCSDP